MKFVIKYLRPFFATMAFGLTIKLLGTLAELVLPYVLSHIVDNVVPREDLSLILLWGGCMVICSLLAYIFNVTANRTAARVARNATRAIRHDLFEKTMLLSSKQADTFTVPSLESRLTTDTYNVHHVIGMVQRLGVRAPILLFGGIAITLMLDPVLTLVMVAILPFITLSVTLISRKGIPLYTKVQQSVDKMVRVVREDAQGIRVVKALSKVDYERRRYDTVNKNLVADEKRAGITMAATNPLMNLFLNLGLVAVIFVGAFRVNAGLSQPGKIIAFMQYFTLISNAMMSITRIFVQINKGTASANRIAEVIGTDTDIAPLPAEDLEGMGVGDPAAHITFENVTFSYNKTKNNLQNISFSIPRGGTLGIIGATGSGKSTMIQLLMRFYDVDSGRILIDGRDIRTYEAGVLHSRFGVALQNDFLYADTVEENIKFGRELTHEQVVRAATLAQAADFIDGFEEGYEHMLTSKGTNVSGGQKQRLLISRAIAGDPDILILDDSSSALDYKTDANLRRAIKEHMADTTTVVVAQRISSVMSSDLILVIEEGEVIGMGSHEHLMATCEVYREISESQMGGAFLE